MKCIKGCPPGEDLHAFPKNPVRRVQWLNLLGVEASSKRIYACSRHFAPEMIFGKRVSKYAVPKNENANSLTFDLTRTPNEFLLCSDTNTEAGGTLDVALQNQLDNFVEDMVVDGDVGKQDSNLNVQLHDDLDFLLPNTDEAQNEPSLDVVEHVKIFVPSSPKKKLKTLRSAMDRFRSLYIAERRMNNRLKAGNARLTSELNKCQAKVKRLELELNKNNDLSSKISKSMLVCLNNGLKNHNRDPRTRRYDQATKLISLGVLFLSPLAYRHLRPILDWPQIRTLQRFVEEWPKTPGNLHGSFVALKTRAESFTKEQKFISISCDEMALKTFLDYCANKDMIIGLQDFGDENRSNCLATSVTVIMASGIGGDSWSQAVSYFFVYGSCEGSLLKKYIFEAISKLEAIGLNSCQFVCDQGSNFQNFAKVAGVTVQTPYFIVNKRKIFFMFDCPHLLKSARNCLLNVKNSIYFNNKLVSWNDVLHFFKVDSSNNLKCAPKLSKEHINPNNFQRMRVNLASQVLSNTVSVGMRVLYQSGQIDKSSSSTFLNTSEYLKFFNDIFDIFNIRGDCIAFNCSDEQLEILRNASNQLKTFRVIDEKGLDITGYFKFINGWQLNISALKSLWQYLEKEGFHSLKTRRLTQDHLEHFFGQIRKGSGNAVSITPRNFSSSFQKRWGLHYVNVVVNGNCENVSPSDSIIDFSIVDEAFSGINNNKLWEEFHSFMWML